MSLSWSCSHPLTAPAPPPLPSSLSPQHKWLSFLVHSIPNSQVPPAELESLLISNSAIEDAAVIGVPDERAGELPRAFVVKKTNERITEEQIIKFIEERVAPHKTLKGGVEFIDKIPRSLSGKILRRELKARVMTRLTTVTENKNNEDEKNVIRSKNPDVEIPDNLSWNEYIFQDFDEYADREAIVSLLSFIIIFLFTYSLWTGPSFLTLQYVRFLDRGKLWGLELHEPTRGLVPDPRQTSLRLVSNLPAGRETRVLQR